MQTLFKLPSERIDKLFTGAPVVLKKGLDQASADRYCQVLKKAGALASAVAVDASDKPSKPGSNAVSQPAPANKNSVSPDKEPLNSPKKMTLAERLAQQEAEAKAAEAAAEEEDASGITLADVGADLSDAVQQDEVVAVDVAHISLKAQQGNLLDDAEYRQAEILDLDLNEYVLDEAGSDLLKPEEQRVFEAADIDTSSMELSPVGEDLGEIKDDKPLVKPDISGLSLVDP